MTRPARTFTAVALKEHDAEVATRALLRHGVLMVASNVVALGVIRLLGRARRREDGSAAAGVLAVIGVLAVVAAIVVGGYLGGWWLQGDIQNRQAHLRRTTFEQQTTYRDEMIRKIADVRSIDNQLGMVEETPTPDPEVLARLRAQRQAVVDIVCRDNAHINGGLDAATDRFVQKECT